MDSFKYPGPTCQTMLWYDGVDQGTMVRTRSSAPSTVGFTGWGGAPHVPAKGVCAYLNPRKKGTVRAPQATFDRLRKKGGTAKISSPQNIASHKWPYGAPSAAIEQAITIRKQTIKVIRPTAADDAGKNLPSTLQLAESLRAIPAAERARSTTIILSPNAHTSSTRTATIAGEAGLGEITLFPMNSAQTQNDFDNRLAHESGHNLQEKLWNSGTAVGGWRSAAKADNRIPSKYAGGNTGDDFCEFNILYNTAKGTPCESEAKRLYPNRWKKRAAYP